jgi:S-adenosylmethionine decarboxylase
MPKTWPYIQKTTLAEFFAGERRTERRERVQALGRHLLLELFDCDAEALNSLEIVKSSMVEAAKRAQATIVDVVFHEFNPFGISGVVVIAESHLAIHTWPEYRYAAVDVFSCGDVLQPQTAADYLVEQLGAARASVVELQRGIFLHASPMPHKPGARVSDPKVIVGG